MRSLALAALCLTLFAANARADHFSSDRCEEIRQSVLADLPRFCVEPHMDHARLADFGIQAKVLSRNCRQEALAIELREAISRKTEDHDNTTCSATAEKMVRLKKGETASALAADHTQSF